MRQESKLKLECMAIGSLPHCCVEDAMDLVKSSFPNIPFWPQLAKVSKNEDMIYQFLENMPAFLADEENAKSYMDSEYDDFCTDLEQFFLDYEEITSDINSDLLEKYGISQKNSAAFPHFIDLVKTTKPAFAKGQIVGPFTLATTLVDKNGRCVYYDEALREIVVKTLTLKALWQIKQIKASSPKTTPIIFIDEPSISQLGTSAYITITQEEVIEILKEISDLIQSTGAMSAIHCCGKCDWTVPVKAGVNIINLDAYGFAQNLSVFYKSISQFLNKGGKIAWGVVPTLDKIALEKADTGLILSKFDAAVNYLTKKGIDEKLIIDNSIITPSCGAGALSKELAQKAMELTKNVSDSLKEKYKIDC